MHKVTYLNDEEMQDVVGGSSQVIQGGVIGRVIGGFGSFGSVVASESSSLGLGRNFGNIANNLTGPGFFNTQFDFLVAPAGITNAGNGGIRFRLDLSSINVLGSGTNKLKADFNFIN